MPVALGLLVGTRLLRWRAAWRVWRMLCVVLASLCGLAAAWGQGSAAEPNAPTVQVAAQGQATAAPPADCQRSRRPQNAQRTVSRDGAMLDAQTVALPDVLQRDWMRERTHIGYRLALDDGCMASGGQAVWVYRIGAPYRIAVDGRALLPIQPFADAGKHVYNGRVPALFALPVGARELQVELTALPFVPRGLIGVELGPYEALADARALDSRALTGFNDASSLVISLIGVLALSAWFLRRKDRALLWFGLACMAWAVRGLAYQTFVVPGDGQWMEQTNPLLVLVTCACMVVSTLHSVRQAHRRWLHGLAWTVAIVGGWLLASLLLGWGGALARLLCFVAAFAMVIAVMVALARQSVVSREQTALMMAGFVAMVAGAVHDLSMVGGLITPNHWSMVTPGFTLMLLCYTLAVSRYLVRNLNRAETANEELEAVIASRTAELEASYRLLGERERETARTQEREHLLREMHDGLGAQLMTALRGVERGAMPRETVQQALQDALDDLRLLMDSTDLGRTLSGALVAWRSRWAPRLEALGIGFRWDVDDDLEALSLNADTVLQIMRIVQEATVNVIKHAQAQHIALAAHWQRPEAGNANGILSLSITDNGVGLPAADGVRPGARGLANMAARARIIGARLSTDASPQGGGTCVSLQLELAASDALVARGAERRQATNPRRAASMAASARDEMPSLR